MLCKNSAAIQQLRELHYWSLSTVSVNTTLTASREEPTCDVRVLAVASTTFETQLLLTSETEPAGSTSCNRFWQRAGFKAFKPAVECRCLDRHVKGHLQGASRVNRRWLAIVAAQMRMLCALTCSCSLSVDRNASRRARREETGSW